MCLVTKVDASILNEMLQWFRIFSVSGYNFKYFFVILTFSNIVFQNISHFFIFFCWLDLINTNWTACHFGIFLVFYFKQFGSFFFVSFECVTLSLKFYIIYGNWKRKFKNQEIFMVSLCYWLINVSITEMPPKTKTFPI